MSEEAPAFVLPTPASIFRAPEHVIAAFCRCTGTSIEDLASDAKTQPVTRLRHELMYFLRRMTHLPQTAIGRHVGGRDMSTVHSGIANVADKIATDPEYRARMQRLQSMMLAHPLDGKPAPRDSEAEVALKVALCVLNSRYLSDAEARSAAATVLETHVQGPRSWVAAAANA